MRAREKAENLVNNHYELLTVLIPVNDGYERAKRHDKLFPIAKQCALIAVDEIESLLHFYVVGHNEREERKFWEDVKTEIEKL
jgi:hypothetical protein